MPDANNLSLLKVVQSIIMSCSTPQSSPKLENIVLMPNYLLCIGSGNKSSQPGLITSDNLKK